MHTITPLFVLLIINISYSQSTSSSESNQELKKQDSINYSIKKQHFCEALANDSIVKIKSPWNFYKINVLSCKGNRSSQEVELVIIAKQSQLNQRVKFDFNKSSVIDGLGKGLKVGYNSKGPSLIYTDMPVQITIVIQGVMPGTEKIGHLGLKMSSKDVTISSFTADYKIVELRNINIEW